MIIRKPQHKTVIEEGEFAGLLEYLRKLYLTRSRVLGKEIPSVKLNEEK